MGAKGTPGDRAPDRQLNLLLALALCAGLLTTACAETTRHAGPANASGAASEAAPGVALAPLPASEAASPAVPGLEPVSRPDEQLLILRDNTARLYDFDLDALAKLA